MEFQNNSVPLDGSLERRERSRWLRLLQALLRCRSICASVPLLLPIAALYPFNGNGAGVGVAPSYAAGGMRLVSSTVVEAAPAATQSSGEGLWVVLAVLLLAVLLFFRLRLHAIHRRESWRLYRRYRVSRRGRALRTMDAIGRRVHTLAMVAGERAGSVGFEKMAGISFLRGEQVASQRRNHVLGSHRSELEEKRPVKKRLHARPGRNSFWE